MIVENVLEAFIVIANKAIVSSLTENSLSCSNDIIVLSLAERIKQGSIRERIRFFTSNVIVYTWTDYLRVRVLLVVIYSS